MLHGSLLERSECLALAMMREPHQLQAEDLQVRKQVPSLELP